MNFFCTKKHYEEWKQDNPVDEDQVFILKAEEALVVARMLFWD